jgi:hypothetical protein
MILRKGYSKLVVAKACAQVLQIRTAHIAATHRCGIRELLADLFRRHGKVPLEIDAQIRQSLAHRIFVSRYLLKKVVPFIFVLNDPLINPGLFYSIDVHQLVQCEQLAKEDTWEKLIQLN